jgi:hypothetical protein
MNFPIEYKNGNVNVSLYGDGTKIREWPDGEMPRAELPESFDLKITQYCDMDAVCVYCHEMSNRQGKHGDLQWVQELLKGANAGMEIAIGGGNPLAHPELESFLEFCSEHSIVANLTVNSLHLKPYREMLERLQNNNLIHGLGISYRGKKHFKLHDWLNYDNVVHHLILGIHDLEDCLFVYQRCQIADVTAKILLLGYKQFGNGATFYSKELQESLDKWKNNVYILTKRVSGVLCFDNLAVEQLELQNVLTPDQFKLFYNGDDGSHTCYIDAIKKEIARTSTSQERFTETGATLKELFDKVRQ